MTRPPARPASPRPGARLLLVKAPGEALDELRALLHVYVRPHRILAARRRRVGTATRPAREMRRLLPSALLPYRHGLDAVGEIAVGLLGSGRKRAGGRRAVVESGPVHDGTHDPRRCSRRHRRLVAIGRPLLAPGEHRQRDGRGTVLAVPRAGRVALVATGRRDAAVRIMARDPTGHEMVTRSVEVPTGAATVVDLSGHGDLDLTLGPAAEVTHVVVRPPGDVGGTLVYAPGAAGLSILPLESTPSTVVAATVLPRGLILR